MISQAQQADRPLSFLFQSSLARRPVAVRLAGLAFPLYFQIPAKAEYLRVLQGGGYPRSPVSQLLRLAKGEKKPVPFPLAPGARQRDLILESQAHH